MSTTNHKLSEYIQLRRMERKIESACRARGIRPDLFADIQSLGTIREELLILDILRDLPREMSRNPAAKAMVRSAVRSGYTEHPSIARARRQSQ